MADTLLGIETVLQRTKPPTSTRFTLADTLLGIETGGLTDRIGEVASFTLADTLLGIETSMPLMRSSAGLVSLWLIPF